MEQLTEVRRDYCRVKAFVICIVRPNFLYITGLLNCNKRLETANYSKLGRLGKQRASNLIEKMLLSW